MPAAQLREPTFLILTALGAGPAHGYALVQAVEALSQGRVRLRAGTLYGALDRLVEEGMITEAGQEVVDGRLRRYYDLTESGTARLAEATRQLRANAAAATAALQVRGVTA